MIERIPDPLMAAICMGILLLTAIGISWAFLFIVGETVEHFTP